MAFNPPVIEITKAGRPDHLEIIMPLFWLSLAILAGIMLAQRFSLALATWLLLAGLGLIFILAQAAWRRFRTAPGGRSLPELRKPIFTSLLPLPVLITAVLIGAARYQSTVPNLNDPAFIGTHNDSQQQVVVSGILVAMPDQGDTTTSLRLKSEKLHPAGDLHIMDVTGLVLVTTNSSRRFQYGDRVVARGYLETPSQNETFSYRDYLARQGIYTQMRNARVGLLETGQGNWLMAPILRLKTRALQLVFQLWPDPEASLFAGILLGVETHIPEPVQQAFQKTGTSHIIAISGFNIAIVAALFTRSFGRIWGPYKGGLAALAAIAIYTILVGADAAVVRAAIMGGLSLAAGLVGRRQSGVYTLVITAGIMSLVNPQILWDLGFQLSFAATLGLVLYAEPLAQAFTRLASRWVPAESAQKISGPMGEFILFTFAAQLTTLPLIAYHFGTISWIAFLANPVILPAQPPIMVLGGLALILGLVWTPLGKLTAPIAWPFVLFTVRAAEFFSQFTHGVLKLGKFSLLWVLLFYALLLAATFGWDRLQDWFSTRRDRLRAGILVPLVTLLGILAVVAWRAALAAPDGRLHVTLLAVGSGDALLIQTPAGRYALLNGGPSTTLLSDSLGRRLPPFHRHLDWLVVASPRAEQVAGMARSLDRFPPVEVLWAGLPSPSREADYLRESLVAQDIPILNAEVGQSLLLGDGAELRVLAAGPRGAILLLEWDRFRALLPLGISASDFEALRMGDAVGEVTVLLLAENGYSPLNPPEWIANLHPRVVLLSVAAGDRQGLPDRELLESLRGYTLLRTDQNGWIQLTTDGQQLWVEVERR